VTPTVMPTVTPTVTPTPSAAVFNVKDYGAKGDSSVDDRPAIQRAVDACAAVGGGTVYVPAGNYRLDTGVVPSGSYYWIGILLKDNVSLVGDGASTRILSSKTYLNNIGAIKAHDITISNLDTGTVAGAASQNGIKTGSCDRVRISRVNAFGHYIAISTYGSTNVAISDCTAHDSSWGFCLGDDVVNQVPQTGSRDQVLSNSEAYNCDVGIRVDRGGSATLTNCYSHDNVTGLLATKMTGLVVNQGRYDNNHQDVANNTGWGGIALAGVAGATLTGVEMSGNTDASGPGNSVQLVMASTYGACSSIVVNGVTVK
jgi:hypothetical protein